MLPAPASKLQVTVVHEIAASAAQVFAALTTTGGMQAWAPGCRSAEWQHPPGATQPGLGSVRRLLLQGGNVATERMVAWVPGRELHYALVDDMPVITPLTRNYVGVTRVEPLGPNASRLTWQLHFETPGLRRVTAPLLRLLMRFAIAGMAGRIAEAAQREVAASGA